MRLGNSVQFSIVHAQARDACCIPYLWKTELPWVEWPFFIARCMPQVTGPHGSPPRCCSMCCVEGHSGLGKGEKGHRIQKGSWSLLDAKPPAIHLLILQSIHPEGARMARLQIWNNPIQDWRAPLSTPMGYPSILHLSWTLHVGYLLTQFCICMWVQKCRITLCP